MKTLSLIPKKVKETYQIEKRKDCIEVHSPAYVNIQFDKEFEIVKDGTTIIIKNSKCCVSLWIEIKIQHITIYYFIIITSKFYYFWFPDLSFLSSSDNS